MSDNMNIIKAGYAETFNGTSNNDYLSGLY